MHNCLRIHHNIRARFLNLGNQLHVTSYPIWLANSNSSTSKSQFSWPPKASLTNFYPLLGPPETETLLPSIVRLLLECFHSSMRWTDSQKQVLHLIHIISSTVSNSKQFKTKTTWMNQGITWRTVSKLSINSFTKL